MMCPKCENLKTYIIETREDNEFSIRRRRRCPACGFRFTTFERLVQMGFLRKRETK